MNPGAENRPRNIIILGFKACGKSTVGKALARCLSCEFVDLDQAIERAHRRRTGQTMACREIYRRLGREYFRELEQKVLREVVEGTSGVVALGGGSLMETPDPEALLKESFRVYLSVEPETLFARVMAGGVPAFFDPQNPRASFDELCAQRLPCYRRLANITVDNTDRSPEAAVNEIVAALKNTQLSARRGK